MSLSSLLKTFLQRYSRLVQQYASMFDPKDPHFNPKNWTWAWVTLFHNTMEVVSSKDGWIMLLVPMADRIRYGKDYQV